MGNQADARPRSLTPGFLLDRGRYTTLEVPGATVETAPSGINNRGMIVGTARGGGSPDRGFLRDPRGRYTTFRFPGARSTLAQKLNDRGQITGYYSNTADDPREDPTGFLRDRGRYTRIAVPGALTTTAVGINNRSQVVGQYQDADRRYHGYVWERGRITTIDVPGAAATSLVDINDRGQILGAYADDLTQRPGTFHGFVLDRGRLRTFDAPPARCSPALRPQQPRPDRGLHRHRSRHRDSPRVPAGQGSRRTLHPDQRPRRALHPGARPQRPRPDHRHL